MVFDKLCPFQRCFALVEGLPGNGLAYLDFKGFSNVLVHLVDQEEHGQVERQEPVAEIGKAVEKHLLTDYKVLVLTLSESQLTPHIKQALEKVDKPETVEIETEDATRLIGCINALSKKTLLDSKLLKESDPEPMHRAVAFCQTIKVSKILPATALFFNASGLVHLVR